MNGVTVATCPACHEPVVPGDQFCEACGADLPAEVATAERPDAAPAPEDPEAELLGGATSTTRLAAEQRCDCGGRFDGDWCDSCGARRPDPRDHQEVDLGPVAAVASDKGRRYARNEDAFALDVGPGRVLAVVCDGVGSTVDPEVASALASEAALEHLRAAPDDLAGAHAAAQAAVVTHDFTPKPDLGAPSCTFLAATAVGTHVRIASLGDCRGYWLADDGEPAVVTRDDSWARAAAEQGLMSWEEARADRRANVITRWLGRDADPSWSVEVTDVVADEPGLLVLCSDGLWNHAPEPVDLAAVVAGVGAQASPLAIATHLVQHALDAGGHDNITVVVVRLPLPTATAAASGSDDPAEPDAEPDADPTAEEATP